MEGMREPHIEFANHFLYDFPHYHLQVLLHLQISCLVLNRDSPETLDCPLIKF